MGSFFKLHVIPPPAPLDWSTPKSLLKDTLYHHLIQDDAPIGHFFIEIYSSNQQFNGVRHIVTGMSRAHKNLSTLKVALAQVGLGTFYYDFPGKLDEGASALREIVWAKKKSRWKSVRVPLLEDRVAVLFDEMDRWIKNGSFRHYGGGHSILKGEGAGCAEMGAHFFNLAVGLRAIPQSWIRSVYAPRSLVGGPRTGFRVSLVDIFMRGGEWAKNEESGILYATPDMELTWNWLENFAPGKLEIDLDPSRVDWTTEQASRIDFTADYAPENEEIIRKVWSQIRVG